MFLTTSQRSDLIADGYFRTISPRSNTCLLIFDTIRICLAEPLRERVTPCIPMRKAQKIPIRQNADLFKKRQKSPEKFCLPQRLVTGRHRFRPLSEGLPLSLRIGCRPHGLGINPAPKFTRPLLRKLLHDYENSAFFGRKATMILA